MLVATIDLLEEHHAAGHGAAKESVGSQMQSMSIAVKVNCSVFLVQSTSSVCQWNVNDKLNMISKFDPSNSESPGWKAGKPKRLSHRGWLLCQPNTLTVPGEN